MQKANTKENELFGTPLPEEQVQRLYFTARKKIHEELSYSAHRLHFLSVHATQHKLLPWHVALKIDRAARFLDSVESDAHAFVYRNEHPEDLPSRTTTFRRFSFETLLVVPSYLFGLLARSWSFTRRELRSARLFYTRRDRSLFGQSKLEWYATRLLASLFVGFTILVAAAASFYIYANTTNLGKHSEHELWKSLTSRIEQLR